MLSKKEINFLLFNNRSINIINNFIDWSFFDETLIEIEKQMRFIKSGFNSVFLEIDTDEILLDKINDIDYSVNDLQKYTNIINDSHEHLLNSKNNEYKWLIDRGINESIIKEYKLGSLTYIDDKDVLEKIGSSCHPSLSKMLVDDNDNGIIIPLFKDNKLINITTRKILDKGKLKYTQSCPELDIWYSDDMVGDEIWISEGIFDMYALKEQNKQCMSVSSAMWSSLQLYKVLKQNFTKINIFCDNDKIGLRTGKILQRFFTFNNIECKTYISEECKDASEHFLEKKLTFDTVKEITITNELIDQQSDQKFDFIEYIKNRKF